MCIEHGSTERMDSFFGAEIVLAAITGICRHLMLDLPKNFTYVLVDNFKDACFMSFESRVSGNH